MAKEKFSLTAFDKKLDSFTSSYKLPQGPLFPRNQFHNFHELICFDPLSSLSSRCEIWMTHMPHQCKSEHVLWCQCFAVLLITYSPFLWLFKPCNLWLQAQAVTYVSALLPTNTFRWNNTGSVWHPSKVFLNYKVQTSLYVTVYLFIFFPVPSETLELSQTST